MGKKYLYTDFVFDDIWEYIPNWQWSEIKTGILECFISTDDVVKYAVHILEIGIDNYDDVLNLAIMEDYDYDDILCLVEKLSSEEFLICEKQIVNKWRFAMLLQLFQNKHKYTNVYMQIAEIDADFNHPDDMKSFVYFRPTDGISMETHWINYLKEKNEIFGNAKKIDISIDD